MFKWSLWQQWREPILIVFACFVICPLPKNFFVNFYSIFFIRFLFFTYSNSNCYFKPVVFKLCSAIHTYSAKIINYWKRHVFKQNRHFWKVFIQGINLKNSCTSWHAIPKNLTDPDKKFCLAFLKILVEKCVKRQKSLYTNVLNKPI